MHEESSPEEEDEDNDEHGQIILVMKSFNPVMNILIADSFNLPKRCRSTGVRRAASACAPIQQRPRRRQRTVEFGAPIANILQDNPPAESAAAENNPRRRDDIQAVALNGHEREEETSQRVLGEIAFQLDRRILSYIFTDQLRLYGFNIPDINQKINEVAGGDRQRDEMNARNTEIMNRLRNFEYCPINHSTFAEFIVNNYGILKEKPQCQLMLANYNNPNYLQKLIVENTPPPLLTNMLVLFASLRNLSEADGRPMFIW
ncbi:speriolin-like protein [Heptranchias perlo]|uniref:speriolin-like protein n=1 Tax=Heptranchias perlo TaxID=212740 RepID=UPI00355A002A